MNSPCLFLALVAISLAFEASDGRSDDRFSYGRPNDAKDGASFDILMPEVKPRKHDTYLCTSVPLSQDQVQYIVQYQPHAEMNTAHHMLMFGCAVPGSHEKVWNCGMGMVCGNGQEKIMYAWGRNAPRLELPKGVAFPVGGDTNVNYLVLQVHYGKVDKFLMNDQLTDSSGVTAVTTPKRPEHLAAITLLSSGGEIYPKEKAWHLDVGCEYKGRAVLHPFAFRVHAHSLGTVISAYRVRNKQWTLIGKGDPQRPQAFYPVQNRDVDIQPDDKLAARCTYNSMSRDRITNIGATMKDEMCNFYTMYYYDADQPDAMNPGENCGEIDDRIFDQMPADSDQPLPDAGGMKMEMKRQLVSCQGDCRGGGALVAAQNWPLGGPADGQLPVEVGQITAVDIDINGDVVLFQRASRVWDYDTFDRENGFTKVGLGPIRQDTVLWLDAQTGRIKRTWGRDRFYLPHGLTIDAHGNMWFTDVAMHQVFKFPPGGDGEAVLTLGRAFTPGNAADQFCKPTDVAIDSAGNVFVSDGYCNHRILKFSPDGNLIMAIDNSALRDVQGPPSFNIPHSVSLDQLRQRLFVADRENGRVLVFHAQNGALLDVLRGFGGRVFAVHYHPSPRGSGVLHVVNGADGSTTVQGYTVDLDTRELLETWRPTEGFTEPHDVSADAHGSVYVTEIGPNRIWKFIPQY